MTLDEAIKHCEEVAEKNESEANFGFGNVCIDRSSCLECAKEHRQLATWLRELKACREAPQPIKRTEERTETHACDCISRQAAIDALWKALHEYEDKTENQFLESKELDVADWFQHRIFVQNMSDIDRQTILNLPSATPQQKTGHWLSQSEYCKMNNLIPSGLGCYFWCSECNCGIDYKYFHLADYNYCPECGAKMEEVEKWQLK